MSTSLAEQLQRYSAPQTSNLNRGKTRPSLLFDPKEAAGIRKEKFYEIGLKGLEELISKDAVFEQFTKTLFSLESRDFERSIELTSSNKKLDKQINKFLLLLSPYILLHCCYKALEWMIYRYSIHQYNREDLLMLVLPYHQTTIFQRVVALMKFEDVNDPWAFLKDSQKAGVPLTNQFLFNHAASDPYFIRFVSDLVLKIIKVHEKPNNLIVTFNFYSQVFLGAIEYSKETPESVITQMFPALLKGLNSDILDFRAASYIITARIVTKCTLSEVILDKFMEKIFKNDGTHLRKEAVLLYSILYQGQAHYKTIPDDALVEIISHDWFPQTLQELNSVGTYIYPFLEVLVKRLMENGVEDEVDYCRTFLADLLDQLNINDESVPIILNVIIDQVPHKLKKKPEIKTWITELIGKIEKQYPTQFDQQVYKILTLKENEDRKKRLQKILRGLVGIQKKFDIFDKLYDSNALIRIDAIKFISTNYKELRDEEKDVLKISLEHRLKDDNYDVVKEALVIIENTKIMQGVGLNKILSELLCRCYKDKHCWGKIVVKVLSLLCTSENASNFDVITMVLPLLLPKTNEEIQIAKVMIKSNLFMNCALFKNFNSDADLNIAGDFPNELFKCLKAPGNDQIILNLYKDTEIPVIKSFSPIQKYIIALLISNTVNKNSSLQKILPLLEILEELSITDTANSTKSDCSILQNLKIAKKGVFPLSGYLECVFNVVINVDKIELKNLDFTSSNPVNKFLLSSCSIFYCHSIVHQAFVDKFNNEIFKTLNVTVDFILHLAVYRGNCDGVTQNTILDILLNKLQSCSLSKFFDLKENYVPYLLMLLTSQDEDTRKKTFEIVKIIAEYPEDSKQSYHSLLKYLMQHQEEIILDSNQLPVIVSNALNPKQNEVLKNTLVDFCCNSENPLYLVAGISESLLEINNINILEKFSVLTDSLLEKGSKIFTEFESTIIHNCLKRFNDAIGKSLKKDLRALKLLVSVIKNDRDCLSINGELISPSLSVMKQMNEAFFSSLSKEIQSVVLDSIIEVSTTPQNPNVLLVSNKIFKHIDLNIEHIIPQLVDMEEVQSVNVSLNRKRKRVSTVPTVDILDTLEWKKGVRVLELIQDKKRIFNVELLIPKLFSILKKCLDFDEQAAVEYPKQLILSLILICCQKVENVKVSKSAFDMELVVQCIRASSNPQTHHHALLVLAHCATLFPTQVLHHIMAIFTFMGSSVLRHDDNYSFQLISSIIESVIPILVQDGSTQTIISVLRVFVDALLDVPEHRRLKLYTHLLEKIDVEEHLHLFLLLVFVSHVQHGTEENSTKKRYKFEDHSTIKRLNIAIELVMEFSPSVGFNACKKLIQNLRKLPINKEDLQKNEFDVDISALTEKQFRHFKYTTLIFINGLVSSKDFIAKIAVLSDQDLENLEPYYKDIIVGILSYIQRTHPILDRNLNTPLGHYWKAIQHQSLEILDCMNALLTPEMFLLVIKGLMSHDLTSIKKRSLDLLNSKLQYTTSFIEECSSEELHSTVNSLITIIDKLNSDPNEDELIVIQTALLSLKLLIKAVGSEDPEKYVKILEFITNIIKLNKAEGYVLSSLILCLAELCITLKSKAIEYLPSFMPVLLRILKQEKHQESPTLLCLSLLTTIQKIFEVLALFISPYLKKLLFEISQLNGKWINSTDDPKLSQFVQKLKLIKQKLAENIPTRILILEIEGCYSDLIEKKKLESIGPIMGILSEHLRHLSSSAEISPHLPKLKQFFLDALEFRNLELCTLEQTNIIENHIIDALSTLVLKLSDSAFKPFFSKIFNWATGSEDKNNRIITFYNLSCGLATQLKSLFVLFADVFIKNASKILDECNNKKSVPLYFEDQEKNTLLLDKVLETLKLIFEHTTRKFITKDRFEVLMQPIVDNLENDLNGIDDLELRNKQLLTPCIVHFAVATGDDSLWKQLNYQILLKMRNSNHKIRLISLKCLTEVVKTLGEDFLPLLPETIPFLSELLEDDHEIIQVNCKKSIQELEEVLGENLSKYF